MESVELGTINYSVVVLDQNVPAGLEGIEDNCSGVAKLNLENWYVVLPPPRFTGGSMVFSQLEEMAEDRYSAGRLGDARDMGNVGAIRVLWSALAHCSN